MSDYSEPNFPEHFTSVMQEMYHMLNSVALLSAHALGNYGAFDLAQSLNGLGMAFAAWNVHMGVLSQEEMEEVMSFGENHAKREALAALKAELEGVDNTDELEALFSAPAFGETNHDATANRINPAITEGNDEFNAAEDARVTDLMNDLGIDSIIDADPGDENDKENV